jgi:hypothetical protein
MASLICLGAGNAGYLHAGGITPEQIYETNVFWKELVGTWEVLPDDNPLAEKCPTLTTPPYRALMTLREDGTCRVFNEDHPQGSDAMWHFEKKRITITFLNAPSIVYYVYGVEGGFMVTRSDGTHGRDQLWSLVR